MLPLPPRRKARRSRSSTTTVSKDCDDDNTSDNLTNYVIIGGGIAGVCCAQELSRLYGEDDNVTITLISATDVLKESVGVMQVTKHLEEISIYERTAQAFQLNNPSIRVVKGTVTRIDSCDKCVYVTDDSSSDCNCNSDKIIYSKLCICTGAQPKLIVNNSNNVIGIRDIVSVNDLLARLQSAKKIVVIGNGGIALELIHALTFCDVDWIVKDDYIGSAFFDATASAFIMPSIIQRATSKDGSNNPDSSSKSVVGKSHNDPKQPHVNASSSNDSMNDAIAVIAADSISLQYGAALGPEWLAKSDLRKKLDSKCHAHTHTGQLAVQFKQEVIGMYDSTATTTATTATTDHVMGRWQCLNESFSSMVHADVSKLTEYPLYISTTAGTVIGCDFIVSATGVACNSSVFLRDTTKVAIDDDGLLIVDEHMRTSDSDIYAAGDCCICKGSNIDDKNNHWFQMKLWTQARSMGMYAAHCMCDQADDYGSDFFLELFAHMTRFFGYKVVLLGRYNAQGLGVEIENMIKEMVVVNDGLIKKENAHLLSQGMCNKDSIEPSYYCNANDIKDNSNNSNVEIWYRVIPNSQYIKLVVQDGKIVGALLIGDTNLEETFENLILNRLDVSGIGIDLLNVDVDIEDFFD